MLIRHKPRVLSLFLSTGALSAQQLTGRVTDSTGAVIPKANDTPCTQPNLQRVPDATYGPNTNTVYTGVRIPSSYQWDTNVSKNFKLYERLSLQTRLKAYNVPNHPLWSEGPDTNFNDPHFGEIQRGNSGQSNLPRYLQLSAKITLVVRKS